MFDLPKVFGIEGIYFLHSSSLCNHSHVEGMVDSCQVAN
jgi:hypothetical protein